MTSETCECAKEKLKLYETLADLLDQGYELMLRQDMDGLRKYTAQMDLLASRFTAHAITASDTTGPLAADPQTRSRLVDIQADLLKKSTRNKQILAIHLDNIALVSRSLTPKSASHGTPAGTRPAQTAPPNRFSRKV